MIFGHWPNWRITSRGSRSTTSPAPTPSNGSSHGATSRSFYPDCTARISVVWHEQYVIELSGQSTKRESFLSRARLGPCEAALREVLAPGWRISQEISQRRL
ncbi:MAG: hypothetical protein MUO70_10110, partial [Euryarchaeota archaeon]|nr:hypothetical protein [Euryarchaeota archaeon]